MDLKAHPVDYNEFYIVSLIEDNLNTLSALKKAITHSTQDITLSILKK